MQTSSNHLQLTTPPRKMAETASVTAAPTPPAASLHANLSLLAPLVGVWTGTGAGTYPTIQPFHYTETVAFTAPSPARPVLTYTQFTAMGGKPAHSETGYWKLGAGGRAVECCVAQVTGLAEVEEGAVTADEAAGEVVVDVRTVGLTRPSSAKAPHVRDVRRVWRLSSGGTQLSYEVYMATDKTPELTLHLKAHFDKQQPHS